MNKANTDTSNVLLEKVGDWLMKSALAGEELETIVRGFCERLAAAGLPLARIHLTFSVLHPLYRATGFTWHRGKGVTAESYRHVTNGQTDRFSTSPYYYLLTNELDHLRRRIDHNGPSEFPIFDDFREQGITDYLAFVHSLDSKTEQAMMGSWSTDRVEGFSDSTISGLLRIQHQLAAAAKMAVLGKLASNMLTTYLGKDAGKRVLSGQIKRGDGETVRAALVMADMRNSTMLAEKHGRQVYIDTLNQFFDTIATPFNRGGGQILSFIGDGFLAVYPCDRHKQESQTACRAALAAAQLAEARMAELNRERLKKGLWEIGYGIGLHVGNVMFGNVGLSDRLTFSVFGGATNEVARLQVLTKKFGTKIVASHGFANYCGGEWDMLGAEKLRGVERAVKVLSPGSAGLSVAEAVEAVERSDEGLSDAEHLVILHRESQKPSNRVATQ
jgi:adenylate cyclase